MTPRKPGCGFARTCAASAVCAQVSRAFPTPSRWCPSSIASWSTLASSRSGTVATRRCTWAARTGCPETSTVASSCCFRWRPPNSDRRCWRPGGDVRRQPQIRGCSPTAATAPPGQGDEAFRAAHCTARPEGAGPRPRRLRVLLASPRRIGPPDAGDRQWQRVARLGASAARAMPTLPPHAPVHCSRVAMAHSVRSHDHLAQPPASPPSKQPPRPPPSSAARVCSGVRSSRLGKCRGNTTFGGCQPTTWMSAFGRFVPPEAGVGWCSRYLRR
jgi:hypothetical protein